MGSTKKREDSWIFKKHSNKRYCLPMKDWLSFVKFTPLSLKLIFSPFQCLFFHKLKIVIVFSKLYAEMEIPSLIIQRNILTLFVSCAPKVQIYRNCFSRFNLVFSIPTSLGSNYRVKSQLLFNNFIFVWFFDPGTGTFGRVCLCRHYETNEYCAMKILAMSDVIRLKQVEHVKNEKSILKEVNHPFIVNL